MLLNPHQDKQLTLASFALFVASKDPNEAYDFQNAQECACGQWLRSMGMEVPPPSSWPTLGDLGVANALASRSRHFGALSEHILACQMESA